MIRKKNTRLSHKERVQIVITGKVHHYDVENPKLYFIYSQTGVKKSNELINIDSLGNFEYRIKGYIPWMGSVASVIIGSGFSR